MNHLRTRGGLSLFELLLVIILVALVAGIAAPAARSTVDQVATRSAREVVVGLVARTRTEARAHGGAGLRLDAQEGVVQVLVGDSVAESVSLAEEFGVGFDVGRGADEAVLRYGPRGIGAVASRTITLEKGRSRQRLTISSHGRVARR